MSFNISQVTVESDPDLTSNQEPVLPGPLVLNFALSLSARKMDVWPLVVSQRVNQIMSSEVKYESSGEERKMTQQQTQNNYTTLLEFKEMNTSKMSTRL